METVAGISELFGSTAQQPIIKNQPGQLGQEDFLRLLVVQMENQDPTKPMDNSEFLSQIAQFGMVDGIRNLETSFATVASSLQGSLTLEAATLLGREVMSEGNTVALGTQGAAHGILDLPESATSVQVEIRSESGLLLRSISLGQAGRGELAFSWDGKDAAGQQMPPGNYLISANALIQGQVREVPTKTQNRVASITIDQSNAQVLLNLSNGKSIDLAAVTEIK